MADDDEPVDELEEELESEDDADGEENQQGDSVPPPSSGNNVRGEQEPRPQSLRFKPSDFINELKVFGYIATGVLIGVGLATIYNTSGVPKALYLLQGLLACMLGSALIYFVVANRVKSHLRKPIEDGRLQQFLKQLAEKIAELKPEWAVFINEFKDELKFLPKLWFATISARGALMMSFATMGSLIALGTLISMQVQTKIMESQTSIAKIQASMEMFQVGSLIEESFKQYSRGRRDYEGVVDEARIARVLQLVKGAGSVVDGQPVVDGRPTLKQNLRSSQPGASLGAYVCLSRLGEKPNMDGLRIVAESCEISLDESDFAFENLTLLASAVQWSEFVDGDFLEATLYGSRIDNCEFQNVTWNDVFLTWVKFRDDDWTTVLQDSTFTKCTWVDVTFDKCSTARLLIRDSSLTNCEMRGGDIGVSLMDCEFVDVRFEDCESLNLEVIDCKPAPKIEIKDCDIRTLDVSGTDLNNVVVIIEGKTYKATEEFLISILPSPERLKSSSTTFAK